YPADHRGNGSPDGARLRPADCAQPGGHDQGTAGRRGGHLPARGRPGRGRGLVAVTGVRAAAAPLASPAFRRYLARQLASVTCSWARGITLSWVVGALNPRALGPVVVLQLPARL